MKLTDVRLFIVDNQIPPVMFTDIYVNRDTKVKVANDLNSSTLWWVPKFNDIKNAVWDDLDHETT